jgi:heptosyltransferase II
MTSQLPVLSGPVSAQPRPRGAAIATPGPLIVRLPNWVGEVALTLPTLAGLQQLGYQLHLVGKPWAHDLFAGFHWPVYTRPESFRGAVAQLFKLRARINATDPQFSRRPNTLLFPKSHSSALEARAAGLRPVGYASDGRSYLLSRHVHFEPEQHAADGYCRVGAALLQNAERLPRVQIPLSPSLAQASEARRLLDLAHITHDYAVLCPFSGDGDTSGQKRWPKSEALLRRLHALGIKTLICPGPGEEAEARTRYAIATILSGVSLGVYTALMRDAWCTIANDTGPGHLAAFAGGTLLSISGPRFASRWAPIGPRVTRLQFGARWPTVDEVVSNLPLEARDSRPP